MARLVIVKAEDPEAAAAPEMRYLLSLVRLQAERAFAETTGEATGEATVVPAAEAARWTAGLEAGDGVLLLGATDVLVLERSLRALREALERGADVAVPTRLQDVGLPPGAGAYTLSDFERVEARFLEARSPKAGPGAAGATVADSETAADDGPAADEQGGGDWPPRTVADADDAPLLPVSLLTPDAFQRLAEGLPLERLLAGDPPPDGAAAGLEVARGGLYHEFIDYYGEVRADVAPYLPEGAREVLEVGCGRGATGAYLQGELGCRVTGVELNPVVARAASKVLHRVVVGNVEEPETVAALEAPYDAVLALELFEHLVEPERFLERLRPLVRPGGRIVLSVPNVGHHSVVRDLLAGRWDYLPIGILCYTHYRFYTRRTLADWLARSGFPDATLVPQRTEPPDWLPAADGGEDGAEALPILRLPLDRESLRTKGFYVLLDL